MVDVLGTRGSAHLVPIHRWVTQAEKDAITRVIGDRVAERGIVAA